MAAAGWYPDPSGRFELRWFDGATWSSSVSRAGQQFLDAPQGAAGPVDADAAAPFGVSNPVDGSPTQASPFAPSSSPFQPSSPFPPSSSPFQPSSPFPPSSSPFPPAGPYPAGAFPAGPYAGALAPSASNGLAVTALVLGIIGCVAGLIPFFFVIAFLLGALAIVFGALGRKRRAEGPRSKMATAGLILGVVSVGLGVVGVVILTTVIHKVNDTVNEAFSTVPAPADTADPTRDTTAGVGGDVDSFDDQQLTITGEPLPQHESSASVDVAVGTMAPTITGTAFDGTPLTIDSSQGPYLLVFVAHWCPHCNAEIPRLVDWSNNGGLPAGLQVFGIATANDPSRMNYPPQPWLEAKGWPWPALPDQSNGPAAAGAAAEAFGADGWPYMVLVGADGTVTARVSGEVAIEDLQAMVDDTMSGAAAAPATTAVPVDTPTVSLPAVTPTELKVTTLIAGNGPAVKAGDTVSVYYVGALADGTEFDSNFGSGQPIAFRVGVGELIAGWDVGLIGAQAGGRYQLDIPADMAYGSEGSGGIPPNAALIFVVQVTTITPG